MASFPKMEKFNMGVPFADIVYDEPDICVSWHGEKFHADKDFTAFLGEQVKARLDDDAGEENFQTCLRGLDLTGMGRTCLEEVLNTKVPESRAWAMGEAFAEAWLTECYKIEFPWNMERDKRHPFASLPGADLVGFQKIGDKFHLVLGEVKTSGENKSPPQVMSGRSGMVHQLDNVANDLRLVRELISWLYHRTRGGTYEQAFKSSCINYFESQAKDIVLFGILIRDTAPNEQDLSGRGQALRRKLSAPTQCHLIALYLPWDIGHLGVYIRERGAK
jgi:hypothetical protein